GALRTVWQEPPSGNLNSSRVFESYGAGRHSRRCLPPDTVGALFPFHAGAKISSRLKVMQRTFPPGGREKQVALTVRSNFNGSTVPPSAGRATRNPVPRPQAQGANPLRNAERQLSAASRKQPPRKTR